MSTDREIILPGSQRWPEFLAELHLARRCLGTLEHSRSVLARMENVDVEGTVRELVRAGGTCDCVIEYDLTDLLLTQSA